MKYKLIEPFKEEIYQYIGTPDTLILHSLSGITFPDPTYEIQRTNSDMYSIEYIYEGEGAIQQNGNIYKVSAGDFFILHPHTFHHYYSSRKNPWKKIFFTVDSNHRFIDALLKLYNIEDLVYLPKVYHPNRLEEIFELLKHDDGNTHRKLENIVFNMFAEIADIKNMFEYTSSKISVAKKYIDKKITGKITVSDVCRHVNLDISYFGRLFKKTYGMTATEYILQQKIEQSKYLLTNTALSIYDIACNYSFTDSSHYIRSFIKITGISPSQYRNQTHNK